MSINEAEHNQARIEELTAAPPQVTSTRARVLRWVRDIAAVVAFVALGLGLWTQSEQTQATRDAQTTACLEGNRVRAQVQTLWQYIVDESRKANPHPTAKQTSDLDRFEAKVIATYAPRKC